MSISPDQAKSRTKAYRARKDYEAARSIIEDINAKLTMDYRGGTFVHLTHHFILEAKHSLAWTAGVRQNLVTHFSDNWSVAVIDSQAAADAHNMKKSWRRGRIFTILKPKG